MTPDNAQIPISMTEVYRPRRYADTYQGLDGWPVSELVAQERAGDYSQAIALIAAMNLGKTSLARLRGMRRGCTQLAEGSVDPCGQCQHCLDTVAGWNSKFGAYEEINCAESGWLDEVQELVRGGFSYQPVWGRTDHKLPKIVALDELQRAAKNVQQSLLKTIEDSRRIQFIICSTDRDAILPELLNRCLELKIEPPTTEQYAAWLQRIFQAEQLTWEDGVVDAFERGSNRGMRQSLIAIRPLTRTCKHIKSDVAYRHFGLSPAAKSPAESGRW